MKDSYLAQTKLLLDVLPIAGRHKEFALKGGTALNYFYHDMPRLSVDIDLHYLNLNKLSFAEAKADITKKMNDIANEIQRTLGNITCDYDGIAEKLHIRNHGVAIKIDTTTLNRGSIYQPISRSLSQGLSEHFGIAFEVNCLDIDEIYGGKVCAALIRQHPRDLFDVHLLLREQGAINRNIILALIVNLIGTKKPIHEHLSPRKIEIRSVYKQRFVGMANMDVTIDDLERVQSILPGIIVSAFTDTDKEFLLGFKRGEPDWSLLPLPHIKNLPAVERKIDNYKGMREEKRRMLISKLEAILI